MRFLMLLLLLMATARAEEVTPLPGLVRESLTLQGLHGKLEALLIRPDAPGRFPLALITHGMPREQAQMPAMAPQGLLNPAIAFAQRGYASVVVMRTYYGRSEGVFQERLGPCDDRDYLRAGTAAAADVIAALDDLRGQPWVDPDRIVLIGHSMGGFAMLAAGATNPPGVRATISFAGAVGSPRPDFMCQPDRLIAADGAFGKTARIPSLWIFSANDHYFAPPLAQDMIDAYAAHGAPAELYAAPPYDGDGHGLIFAKPEATWWPRVASFIKAAGLPTDLIVPLQPAPDLPPPPVLDAGGEKIFQAYRVSRSLEKAFATDPLGHFGVAFGRRTQSDAAEAAMQFCQIAGRTCHLYAVGNQVQSP
jgi:dienelactone hydrolase